MSPFAALGYLFPAPEKPKTTKEGYFVAPSKQEYDEVLKVVRAFRDLDKGSRYPTIEEVLEKAQRDEECNIPPNELLRVLRSYVSTKVEYLPDGKCIVRKLVV